MPKLLLCINSLVRTSELSATNHSEAVSPLYQTKISDPIKIIKNIMVPRDNNQE